MANDQVSAWGNFFAKIDGGWAGYDGGAVQELGRLPAPVTSVAALNTAACISQFDGGVLCWGRFSTSLQTSGSTQLQTPAVARVFVARENNNLTFFGHVDGGVVRLRPTPDGGDSVPLPNVIAVGHDCVLWTDAGVSCTTQGNSVTPIPIPVPALSLNDSSLVLQDGSTWWRPTESGIGSRVGIPLFPRLLSGTCAVIGLNRVMCWGPNDRGQLGRDGPDAPPSAPVDVAIDEAVEEISSSWSHSCVVTRRGTIHCWGDNRRGQLGKMPLLSSPPRQVVE